MIHITLTATDIIPYALPAEKVSVLYTETAVTLHRHDIRCGGIDYIRGQRGIIQRIFKIAGFGFKILFVIMYITCYIPRICKFRGIIIADGIITAIYDTASGRHHIRSILWADSENTMTAQTQRYFLPPAKWYLCFPRN